MLMPFVLHDFHFHFQAEESEPLGIQELIDTIKANSFLPNREAAGQFILAVDHCFPIRGQGTVMTGTVLNGAVNINDVSITSLQVSLQVSLRVLVLQTGVLT